MDTNINDKLANKPNFKDGDRVIYQEGSEFVHGIIIGKSMENIIDFWIVLADDPKTFGSHYPYRAFVASHLLLERE